MGNGKVQKKYYPPNTEVNGSFETNYVKCDLHIFDRLDTILFGNDSVDIVILTLIAKCFLLHKGIQVSSKLESVGCTLTAADIYICVYINFVN